MSKTKEKEKLVRGKVDAKNNRSNKLWALLVLTMTLVVLLGFGGYFIYNGSKDVNEKKVSEDIYNKVKIKTVEETKSIDKEGLLYIYADSCVHCQNLKPTIVEYLKKDDALNFKSMNVDELDSVEIDVNGEKVKSVIDRENLNRTELGKVFKKYGLTDKFEGTPTLVYIKDGKLKNTYVGDSTRVEEIPVKK